MVGVRVELSVGNLFAQRGKCFAMKSTNLRPTSIFEVVSSAHDCYVWANRGQANLQITPDRVQQLVSTRRREAGDCAGLISRHVGMNCWVSNLSFPALHHDLTWKRMCVLRENVRQTGNGGGLLNIEKSG